MLFRLIVTALLGSFLLSQPATAQDRRYVDDTRSVPLRSDAFAEASPIRAGVPSGSAVTLLSERAETGWALVRTEDGTEGWIPTRYLKREAGPRYQIINALRQLGQPDDGSVALSAAIEQARREAAQVAARRAQLQRFVDRFKAKASKAKQAQSRVKALEKLTAAPVPAEESEVHWTVPAPAKLPDPLLQIRGAAVGYGERRVLENVSMFLEPGDRVGLLGRNGAGKSTFMKLLAGVLEPFSGERKAARDLAIGYFAQSQVEELAGDATGFPAARLSLKAHEAKVLVSG